MRRIPLLPFALAILVALAALWALAQQTPRLTTPEEIARVEVLRRSLPAVVLVQGIAQDPTTGNEGPITGSGFFYSPTRIVTNYHVVNELRDLRVTLNDGREFPAEIVALDRGIDIAILGVRGVVAPATLQWGGSQNLPPGMSVLVIGSPFSQRNLASTGILAGIAPLSAESDNPEIGQEIGDVLYIDSRTEQGNSGGPVLDLQGRVIGLMDAVLAGASGIGGYGVAIPAELVRQSIQDLERFGVPQRGWLGASLVDLGDLDPLLLRGVGLVSSQGTMLDKIERGSPAANAGLRAAQRDPRGRLVNLGDIILAINGKAVKNKAEVTQTIARFRPGDRVKLIIWREGRKIEVTLTMIARR